MSIKHAEYLSANVISKDLGSIGDFLISDTVLSPPQIILISEIFDK